MNTNYMCLLCDNSELKNYRQVVNYEITFVHGIKSYTFLGLYTLYSILSLL